MQVLSSPGAEGKNATAGRPIKSGELVLACKPLVCVPVADRLRCGNVCAGCLGAVAPSSTHSTRCQHCSASFCSNDCFRHFARHHVESGECAVLHTVGAPRGNAAADDLIMLSALLARARIAGSKIPQEKPVVAAPAATAATISTAQPVEITVAQHTMEQLPVIAVPHTQPTATVAASSVPCSSAAPPAPPTPTAASSASAAASAAPQQPRSPTTQDEEAENDEEDEEEEQEQQVHQQQQQQQQKRKGRKRDQDKAKRKKQQQQQQQQQARRPDPRGFADGNAPALQKQQLDITLVSTQPRVSIASAFPECSNATTTTAAAATSAAPAWEFRPPCATPGTSPTTTKAAAAAGYMLISDAAARHAAIAAAPQPTFADFCDLISNGDVLSKNDAASYETLRRKYVAMAARCPDFFVPNVDPVFFRHLCSVYRCNAFGIYGPRDEDLGLAIYPQASYFNHSCAPNLLRRMDGKCAVFYAARDILQDEPLTICYSGVSSWSTSVRRDYLLSNYRFWCRCGLCEGSAQSAQQRLAECDCPGHGFLRTVLGGVGVECSRCAAFTPAVN